MNFNRTYSAFIALACLFVFALQAHAQNQNLYHNWNHGDLRGTLKYSGDAHLYVPDDTRKLISGDMIRFQVLEDEDQPILRVVNDMGYVDFPYVGQMKVEGYTCKEVADALDELLEKTYYWEGAATVYIGVERSNPVRGRVYINGYVNGPGAIPIPADSNFTLRKAIFAAGGFKNIANKEEVVVRRLNPETGNIDKLVFDMEEVIDEGKIDKDPLLKPEDDIYVDKKFWDI